jgi:DegV family protein with EDD domain
MPIKIVTDSTAYLTDEMIEAYDISVVSLNVILNGKTYREVELSNEFFYEEMAKAKEIPTSSQPTPEEMIHTFESLLEEGNDIVGIFMSSGLSGTFESTHLFRDMALEKYPDRKIELIDSTSCCMQMGYPVLEAAKAAKAGQPLEEIVACATWAIEHSRFIFTPETLEYLQKGGRIGGATALLGNILQLKPILTVVDGKSAVLTKVRTKKKAVSTLVDTLLEDIKKGLPLAGVTVHHINCLEEGKILAALLEEKLKLSIPIISIGPIVGLHVGPGSVGLAYHFAKS